ncbi:MAG: hypothetical protein KME40_32590 [Komarekiella atlantica HA4396-MV6]|jgi:hypothetical protein|nr:hypothetical protein [Komarekiella atlantica HA4396-MV6]
MSRAKQTINPYAELNDTKGFRELSDIESSLVTGGVAWSTSWKDTSLTQNDCENTARLAILRSGLNAQYANPQTWYAYSGDNVVFARCVGSKNLVYFTGAGSSSFSDVSTLRENVSNNFF